MTYREGDIVRITKRIWGHGFKIKEICKIKKVEKYDFVIENMNCEIYFWLHFDEFEPYDIERQQMIEIENEL